MSRFRRCKCVLLLWCFLGFGEELYAQANLTLRAETDKPSYLIGEPVVLRISLVCIGGGKVAVRYRDNEMWSGVVFSVDLLDKTGKELSSSAMGLGGNIVSPARYELTPGDLLTCKKVYLPHIVTHSDGQVKGSLAGAGSYYLRVSGPGSEVGGPAMRSAAVPISVVQAGGDDAAAGGLIDWRHGSFFAGTEGARVEMVPRLGELVTKYRESIYAVHVRFRAALDRMQAWYNDKPEGRAGLLVGLDEEVSALLSAYPRFPLADELLYERAKLQKRLAGEAPPGREAREPFVLQGKTMLEALVRDYPDSPHVPWAQQELASIQKALESPAGGQ